MVSLYCQVEIVKTRSTALIRRQLQFLLAFKSHINYVYDSTYLSEEYVNKMIEL